jgi:hypothetical protein
MPLINKSHRGTPKEQANLSFVGLPDRDNPLAWKRATRAGRLGAVELLGELSDEDLARYQTVACEQAAIEQKHWGLKAASAIGAVVLAASVVWHAATSGLSRWDIAGLGLSGLMGYWPWRAWVCRAMWLLHATRARSEHERRGLLPT